MGLKICSPELGLSPESNSGGEVYDREVINRLCQAGVKVFSLLPKNRPYLKHKNLTVAYAPIKPMFPPHVFSAFVLPYLIKTYKAEKFDILRVHNPYFVGPAASVFKKLYPQVPVIATYHHLEEGINHLIDKIVIRNFDHLIAVSHFTKNEIITRLNYPEEKISVIYDGVGKEFQPGPKPQKLIDHWDLAGNFVILFVGGLKQRKNPAFLLTVLDKIGNKNTVLIYAGTGPLEKSLKLQVQNLGLTDRVKFTGFVPESDKVLLYRLADILVLPSSKEGFGMTLTEAGACGIPVIGNNNSSIREIIQDGQTGFLAKPGDVNDWVEKILQLIKSPDLRQKMGKIALKYVINKFTWRKNIKTQLKIFNQL
ncbi:MAG: glycosyltransferase family 4 protein [Candidatus Beckwithbacteria bacterium]|nr:glycosyltransferase family 4 protein [Candidatus Beckwithbacteria bacterium]